MIFTHNNPLLWVQTTFMLLWFYSVAYNNWCKWCTHQLQQYTFYDFNKILDFFDTLTTRCLQKSLKT